jgi:hypothetical protein
MRAIERLCIFLVEKRDNHTVLIASGSPGLRTRVVLDEPRCAILNEDGRWRIFTSSSIENRPGTLTLHRLCYGDKAHIRVCWFKPSDGNRPINSQDRTVMNQRGSFFPFPVSILVFSGLERTNKKKRKQGNVEYKMGRFFSIAILPGQHQDPRWVIYFSGTTISNILFFLFRMIN